MAVYSALEPVSNALYATLNVAGMTALATGGVGTDIGQNSGFPFLWIEASERVVPTLGTKPGTGRTLELDVRLHAYVEGERWAPAQAIAAKALELLADAPTVTGFNAPAIFHDDTLQFDEQLIAGVKVKELVVMLRLFVDEVVA